MTHEYYAASSAAPPPARPPVSPSSGIEREQADTSSMATVSTLMADPNKMAAHKPAASVPQNVKRPPKDFKGCKCPVLKCVNSNCPCPRNDYPCTLKCTCKGCKNKFGVRGSDPTDDSNTEPVWHSVSLGCQCTVSNCADKRCHCLMRSLKCTSVCKCEDCSNLPGGGGIKPEELGRIEELLMLDENEGPDPEIGEDALRSMVTDMSKAIENKGSDPNKLP